MAGQPAPPGGEEQCPPPAVADGAATASAVAAAEGAAEPHAADAAAAADEILQCAQLRIECAKVCGQQQLLDLVTSSRSGLARVKRASSLPTLAQMQNAAGAERQQLYQQWLQRSGLIRVIVRVRPATGDGEEGTECAVQPVFEGGKKRGITVSVKSAGRQAEVHRFRRFDAVLDGTASQEDVFREVKTMLPQPGVLSGPMQAGCILAYGQTGSGKTHTMQGCTERADTGSCSAGAGLVPRVLEEVFRLGSREQLRVSLSVVEVYNDIAYDLLCEGGGSGAAPDASRAFGAGRAAPPPGLNFRHGCANALEQTACVPVMSAAEAQEVLDMAQQRRSTRSTMFNETSSRSHSIVLVQVSSVLPAASATAADGEGGESSEGGTALGQPNPLLRLALVDLAGSERLRMTDAAKELTEESRHINLSLSSLGTVIHALQHRASHLPFRACLLTRLLEPFFAVGGHITLCVCASPEQRHAQETFCSLRFADRASRVILGGDSNLEQLRAQTLAELREAHAVTHALLKERVPMWRTVKRPRQRLPDGVAGVIMSFMARAGATPSVCQSWARIWRHQARWGRQLRDHPILADAIVQFLDSKAPAAAACRRMWRASKWCRIVLEDTSATVQEASDKHVPWIDATPPTRAAVWEACTAAAATGGDAATAPDCPRSRVVEFTVRGGADTDALDMLRACSSLRVLDVEDPRQVSATCAALSLGSCPRLKAFRCTAKHLRGPELRDVLLFSKSLRVLVLCGGETFFPLQMLAKALPKPCMLTVLRVARCAISDEAMGAISQACVQLHTLQVLHSCLEMIGGGTNFLSTLGKLRQLRNVDFRAASSGRGLVHDAKESRSWMTDELFAMLSRVRLLSHLRISDQKLVTEHRLCLFLRLSTRLLMLHMDGCKPMVGDRVFNLLHRCGQLESLRLPRLIAEVSHRGPAWHAHRWCKGLRCPRLRELAVETWESLCDSGVQILIGQCPRLRSVSFHQAVDLTDDAVAYLSTLRHLGTLNLTHCYCLTDGCLRNLAMGASKLQSLDMSFCHSMGDEGMAAFAQAVASGQGPSLKTLRWDGCNRLSVRTAFTLASSAQLTTCSLQRCSLIDSAAQHWDSERARVSARDVLRQQGGADLGPDEEQPQCARAACAQDEGEITCSICLSEITSQDPAWACPVCACKLHATEECALAWLRTKKKCPQCRSAAFVPTVATPALLPAPQAPATRPATEGSRHRPPSLGVALAARGPGLAGLGIGGRGAGAIAVQPHRPAEVLQPPVLPRGAPTVGATAGGRGGRGHAVGGRMGGEQRRHGMADRRRHSERGERPLAAGGAGVPLVVPVLTPPAGAGTGTRAAQTKTSAMRRARSLPSDRSKEGSLTLAGLAIIGAAPGLGAAGAGPPAVSARRAPR